MPGPWEKYQNAKPWEKYGGSAAPVQSESEPANPFANAHAPAPLGMTSNNAGDSADWRTRLLGKDGGEDMIKAIPRHAQSVLKGLGNTLIHPIDTAKSILYDQPKQSLEQMSDAMNAGRYSEGLQHFGAAFPVLGPLVSGVARDAKEHGALPALMGLGTDFAGSEVAGRAIGNSTKGARTVARAAGSTPESVKLAATRLLVPGTPGEVLTRALKPSVKYGAGVGEDMQAVLPRIMEQNASIQGVGDLGAASDLAKDANHSAYQARISQYRGGQGTAPRPTTIDGNPVADAQLRSIPSIDLLEKPGTVSPGGMYKTPGIFDKTADVARNYRKGFAVPEIDQLREDANAKLHAFYNKAGGDRVAALANPETARVKAVGDTIREQMYPQIEKDFGLSSGALAEHQQEYGRLTELSDIANKRDVVFSRHDPVSLAEKVAAGHGPVSDVYNFGKQKLLKGLTDSDALVRSAVDRVQNPNGSLQVSPTMQRLGEGLKSSGDVLKRILPFGVLASLGETR